MRPGANRKNQILKEATILFSSSGYDKVTIKSLSEAVGITEPALYRHFESKADIYEAVLSSIESRLGCDRVFADLECSIDLEQILKGLADHILEFFYANEDLYRLLLFSALRGHDRASQVFQLVRGSYVFFLTKKLDQLYELDIIVKKKNDITARCFIGMVFDCSLGNTLWKGFQGKVYKPQEVVANNIPIYVDGLTKK